MECTEFSEEWGKKMLRLGILGVYSGLYKLQSDSQLCQRQDTPQDLASD